MALRLRQQTSDNLVPALASSLPPDPRMDGSSDPRLRLPLLRPIPVHPTTSLLVSSGSRSLVTRRACSTRVVAPLTSVVRVERTAFDVNGRLHIGPPKTAAGKRVVTVPPHILSSLERHLEAYVRAQPSAPSSPRPERRKARPAPAPCRLVRRSEVDRPSRGPLSRSSGRRAHVGGDPGRDDARVDGESRPREHGSSIAGSARGRRS